MDAQRKNEIALVTWYWAYGPRLSGHGREACPSGRLAWFPVVSDLP